MLGEVNVGLVNEQDAAEGFGDGAEGFERFESAGGCVWVDDDGESTACGIELPGEIIGQGEGVTEWDRGDGGIVDLSESFIKGVAGDGVAEACGVADFAGGRGGGAWLAEDGDGEAEQFVAAVGGDNLVLIKVVHLGGGLAEGAGLWLGIEAQLFGVDAVDGIENGGGGGIGVFVGVELDDAVAGSRLFAGQVGCEALDVGSFVGHGVHVVGLTHSKRLKTQ